MVDWSRGVGERGEVENVRGRKEEKMGAELSCKLRESSCVCRCCYVIVWGRNRDNSYHLLGSLSFGFITPKIEQLTNSPTHPSPNLLHPLIFPILGNRTTICPLPQTTEANSSAFSSNCPLNLTGLTTSNATLSPPVQTLPSFYLATSPPFKLGRVVSPHGSWRDLLKS